MPKEARCGGLHETRRRQERDKTQVRQLTGIFQTINGLIDAEDDEALAVAGSAYEGKERETGKDCRGVGVYVDSDELALGERESDGSAKVEIGEVERAEVGILRDGGVEGAVEGNEGSDVGRGRARGGKAVTTRSSAHASIDVVLERTKVTWGRER